MFFRHLNKTWDKNRVKRQPNETARAPKPEMVPVDVDNEVADVPETKGGKRLSLSLSSCQNQNGILPSTENSGAQPLLSDAEATRADVVNYLNPIQVKKNDKQRYHSNRGRIRHISKRQSHKNLNKNDPMPDLSFDHSTNGDDKSDEDLTISILEKECINLTHIMSLLRESHCKYTDEWYVLENRLKIAMEELDAAREDRELHFLSRSNGCTDSGDFGAITSTAHVFATDVCHRVATSPGGSQLESDSSVKTAEEPVTNSHVEQQNDLDCNTSCSIIDEGTDKTHCRSSKYQQIESELQRCIKFTPAWFQLKAELVELTIEQANESKGFDTSDDESSIVTDLEEVHDTPLEINVLRGAADDIITSLAVSSPPMSPISQGSFSSPQQSETLSPSAETGHHYNSSSTVDVVVGNGGNNPSNDSVPTHRRTTSSKSGTGNNNLSMYCYSFNDMDSDDGSGIADFKEENHNMLTNRLKIEYTSLSEELMRLPQYSKEWFEVKMKTVGISEKIVRLELEEVTSEVLVDNQFSSCDGDVDSNGGDSSKNMSSSGWSSVEVWSESEDEIWSYADGLDVGMVSEALKHHSSLYIDQNSSFEDELLFTPEESSIVLEADQHEAGHAAEPVHELVIIQTFVRGMIYRGKYLRMRRMAMRIQSLHRRTSVRSSYKQILANVIRIQVFVRQWLIQRNPCCALEWEARSLKAMQKDCHQRGAENELESEEQEERSRTTESHSEEEKVDSRLEKYDTIMNKKERKIAPVKSVVGAMTVVRCKTNWEINPYSVVNSSPQYGDLEMSTNSKKRLTAEEEKMKILSSESLRLSRRIKSLPPYSPEWTLSKIELNLVIEELEYYLCRINHVRLQGCPV